MKRCTACKREKPLEDFPPNARMADGRSSQCRKCSNAAVRHWRERNRERINTERREAYRAEHPLSERACVVCGKPMTKRPDALVCGKECRREWKREQHRARRAA